MSERSMSAEEYVAIVAGTKAVRGHPEEDFQQLVIDMARRNGWRCHYTPDWVHRLIRADMRNRKRTRDWPDRGFPDLVLCRPPKVLIVENKSAVGKLEPQQREWIADLRACGLDVRVWKPRDEDELTEVLSREAA